jgi:hypothetical protein
VYFGFEQVSLRLTEDLLDLSFALLLFLETLLLLFFLFAFGFFFISLSLFLLFFLFRRCGLFFSLLFLLFLFIDEGLWRRGTSTDFAHALSWLVFNCASWADPDYQGYLGLSFWGSLLELRLTLELHAYFDRLIDE